MNKNVRLVYEFPKGPTEKVRAEVSTYHGKDFLNLRVFFEDDSGKWLPSKKGITLYLEMAEELKTAVDKLVEAYQARSEVGPEATPAA
jgi:hypothetical protein